MNKFLVRYNENGIDKSILFDKSKFTEESAKSYLNAHQIKNFFFFFEPYEPTPFGNNSIIFKGDIGFDITTETILPYLNEGKEIILDSFGGDLFEGWKIHDAIKMLGTNPSIGVIGSCASAATMPLLASENSWMSENSRFLIHNPSTWEAGDDETMRNTANELEKEKLKLANFYAARSGKPTEEILSLMKQEIFISANEALSINFIKSIKSNQINNKKMEKNEVKENLTIIDSALKTIKNLFSPKNMIKQDVNGVEIDFGSEVQTPEQIVVGVKATVNGSPAEGEYVLEDGTTYSFKAGVLEEIKAPETKPNEEMEALKSENEQLKAEVQNKIAENAKLKNEFDAFKNEAEKKFNDVNDKFAKFKNQFSKEGVTPNDTPDGKEKQTSKLNSKEFYENKFALKTNTKK